MLTDELTKIRGIGPGRAGKLAELGLFSVADVMDFYPRDYLDFSVARQISEVEHGEYAAFRVLFIGRGKTVTIKPNMTVTTVSIGDESGNMQAIWYNQPYVIRSIPRETGGYVLGRMDKLHGAKLVNAVFSNSLPGVLPVYPLVHGLTQNVLRSLVSEVLKNELVNVEETLPQYVLEQNSLLDRRTAILNIHFPTDGGLLNEAKRRLAFEDVLIFAITLEKIRAKRKHCSGISFKTSGCMGDFLSLLPFTPTQAQFKVMDELSRDMQSPLPMNRLVQGDVGSGKTVLALFCMYIAMKNGYQSVLMAPTEILAEQHFKQLKSIFGEKCVLLTGNMSKKQAEESLEYIRRGSIFAVTGTHALIESRVEFKRLGVVITDEQHRFGVKQRAVLGNKGTDGLVEPDVLIMSATPIPRTLSLILYGDLDVSIVNGMPPGRKPVKTMIVPPQKRIPMYRYIEKMIVQQGIQAYVVCPMIEENDGLIGVHSAEEVYEELASHLSVKTALIHGKLKNSLKDSTMESFRDGKIDLLVSTTVIEVGVDVPNACTIVIESAERFGLAQLHQLRGRVGRGEKQSSCYLLTESKNPQARRRLEILASTTDGFVIAEKDLEMRGPGEFLGMRQHGVSQFGMAVLADDIKTMNEAKKSALRIMQDENADNLKIVRMAEQRFRKAEGEIAIN